METTIRCHKGSGQDVFSPLEEGPSYLRLICNVTVHYALRRLGGGDLADPCAASPHGHGRPNPNTSWTTPRTSSTTNGRGGLLAACSPS
ncbi:unnamed protein product [Urochloa humidicola]